MSERGVRQTGVALLMTLSIILILSIALMKTFENRSVETAHLANSLQRFQAETLSRSIFRAILITIRTKKLAFVIQNTTSWKGVPIPFNNNQYFQINEIKPIDHLFNLNRRFRPDDPWPRVFLNIINKLRKEKDEFDIPLDIEDTNPVLSAINDWTDWDTDPDDQFFSDNYEGYQEMNPEFIVKNRGLDRLSEVKLIPPFQELGLTHENIWDNFRVFLIDKSSEKQFIDINLATHAYNDKDDELEKFLNSFKDVEGYSAVFENKEKIRNILKERDEELGYDEELGGVLDPKIRFPLPIDNKDYTWKKMLENEGITFNGDEHGLFSGKTKHLSISFSVAVSEVIVTTEAIVEVIYPSENELTIKGFEIISYSMQ